MTDISVDAGTAATPPHRRGQRPAFAPGSAAAPVGHITTATACDTIVDVELARIYAENRLAASLAITVLALVTAAVATLFISPRLATLWLAAMLACHAIAVSLARSFLESAHGGRDLAYWVTRFAGAEMLLALASVAILVPLASGSGSSADMFISFAVLTPIAATATLAATVPAAMRAGTLPIIIAAAAICALRGDPGGVALASLAAGAGLYFAALSNRLHRSRRQSLELRGEKDALIAELEQARANSEGARKRAEEASLTKSRFLATISHELRTPLNAILGFSEIMKGEVFGRHAVPAYRDYSGDIHSSGQHLLTLIDELLDLSRIEAGRYELDEASISLAQVAADCRRLLAIRAQDRSLAMTDRVEASLTPLWADEKALRQIVLNLLSNAIKFTPQGGEITVKIGWTVSGGQYLSVRDTGPGIPEEEIPIVLRSFGQGSLAMRTAEKGAGLGLPIVKGLVELHGGTFALRSAPGRGTEAVVTFPADRALGTPSVQHP